MATLDVTGRTLKESYGKARVAQPPHDRLVATIHGFVPDDGHTGAEHHRHRALSPNRPLNTGDVSSGVNSMAPATAPHGKKHIVVKQHIVLTDDSKRQLGRIGLKRVVPPHQSPRPATASAATSSPKGSGGVERMRLCTAEQQAKRRLERVAASHAELQDVISSGIAAGGDVVVEMEKRIMKHLLLQEAKASERARTPQPERSRSPDLGRTRMITAPFALEGATATLPSSARLSQRKTFSRETNLEKNAEVSPNRAVAVQRFSKKYEHVQRAVAPFDTTLASASYPNPPIVGTVVHLPQGKGHLSFQPEVKNIDEELQKKALARCRFSQNKSTRASADSNLFPTQQETASAPAQPERRVTLRETVENRCRQREDQAAAARRGKMISDRNYPTTALW